MKNIKLFAVISALLLTSCFSQQAILKGNYHDGALTKSISLSYEETWSKVIDFFAMNGIPITTIDKSSGIIVTNRTSFKNSCTLEENGRPQNPNAFIVTTGQPTMFGRALPTSVSGDWNVRIKPDNDKTIVSINLYNVGAKYFDSASKTEYYLQATSTGKFEQMLFDYISAM